MDSKGRNKLFKTRKSKSKSNSNSKSKPSSKPFAPNLSKSSCLSTGPPTFATEFEPALDEKFRKRIVEQRQKRPGHVPSTVHNPATQFWYTSEGTRWANLYVAMANEALDSAIDELDMWKRGYFLWATCDINDQEWIDAAHANAVPVDLTLGRDGVDNFHTKKWTTQFGGMAIVYGGVNQGANIREAQREKKRQREGSLQPTRAADKEAEKAAEQAKEKVVQVVQRSANPPLAPSTRYKRRVVRRPFEQGAPILQEMFANATFSPGANDMQTRRFRSDVLVRSYGNRCESDVMAGLLTCPSHHVTIPIEPKPIEFAMHAMSAGYIVGVQGQRRQIETMSLLENNARVLRVIAGLRAQAQNLVRLNIQARKNGAREVRDAIFERHELLGLGAFNGVWTVPADSAVKRLVSTNEAVVIRVSTRAQPFADVFAETTSLLEAARDGFGLNVHALFTTVEERWSRKEQKQVVRYHLVTLLEQADAAVGQRLRDTTAVGRLSKEYFTSFHTAILSMSLRRVLHIDLSPSNVMDLDLHDPKVRIIDLDGLSYRRIDWSPDADGIARDEGWRPLFLLNFLFAAVWTRTHAPPKDFHGSFFTPAIKALLLQLRSELSESRLAGRHDEAYEVSKQIVTSAKWNRSVPLSACGGDVDRPVDVTEPSRVGRMASEMASFYTYTYYFTEGRARQFVRELRNAHLTTHPTATLERVLNWYDNIYLGQILPLVQHVAHCRVYPPRGSDLLVDVLLEYLQSSDEDLIARCKVQEGGFGRMRAPRTGAEWRALAREPLTRFTDQQILGFC